MTRARNYDHDVFATQTRRRGSGRLCLSHWGNSAGTMSMNDSSLELLLVAYRILTWIVIGITNFSSIGVEAC